MSTLKELVAQPGMRDRIIDDSVVVLEQEVSKKGGMSGMLIKGGFKVISKLERGRMLHRLVDFLLDEFVDALEPFYADFMSQDAGSRPSFSAYVNRREDDVANALLGVTDRKRERAKNKVLIKTYDKLRPYALKNVLEGVPAVGQLFERHII